MHSRASVDKSPLDVKPQDEKTIGTTILELCNKLQTIRSDYRPSVLFAPISFMTPMMLGISTFQVEDGEDSILTGSGKLEIFWSNNYVNFSDFVIMDKKRFAEWVFKSESGDRFVAELDSTTDNMLARTVVSHRILDQKAAIRVSMPLDSKAV